MFKPISSHCNVYLLGDIPALCQALRSAGRQQMSESRKKQKMMKSKVEAGRRWSVSSPAPPVGWKIAPCANLKRSRQQIQKTPGLQIPACIHRSHYTNTQNLSRDPQCNGCPRNSYNLSKMSVNNFLCKFGQINYQLGLRAGISLVDYNLQSQVCRYARIS